MKDDLVYKKLTEDLMKARKAAEGATTGEDGGSANRDCLTIKLKGYRENNVIKAINNAGLTGFKAEWLGPRFFINPPKCGQGNDRVRQVEAMYKVMSDLGYDTLMFEQMD